MNDHLTPEKLELLVDYELRDADLSAALEHVENCAECRRKMAPPKAEDILCRLEPSALRSEDEQHMPAKENTLVFSRLTKRIKRLFRHS